MAAQLATEGVYAPMPSMEEMISKMGEAKAGAGADAMAAAGTGGGAGAPPPAAPVAIDAKLLKTFVCLYTCYYNASLSERKGRRLPVASCVQSPHPYDLAEAAAALGFRGIAVEGKRHPCDPWANGRVRVQLVLPGGALAVPGIASKCALLQRTAALLPTLPGRHARLAEYERMREEGLRRQSAAAKGQTAKAKAPAASAAAAKKKGKG